MFGVIVTLRLRRGASALLALSVRVLVAIATFGGSSAASEGGAPAVLTLAEVTESVERTFPLLAAAEQERVVAEGERLSAEGGFDLTWRTRATVVPVGYYESVRAETVVERPTALWGASGFAGWRLGKGQFPIYDGKQQTLEYGELRAGVNVPLWRNGPIDRRRASLERAEHGVAAAELSVAEQRIQYRRAAAHRYWAWVAAGRRLAIARELLLNVTARSAALATRIERGDLPEFERMDNDRALEQRAAQLAQAERGLEQAAIELGLLLRDASGRPASPSPSRLPESFPDVDGAAPLPETRDVARALERRPEPDRLRRQLLQQGVEARWAANQLAPAIDVQVAATRDIGRALDARPDLSRPVLEASLLVEVPIETRAMRGRRDAATATAARLSHQMRYARERVAADVRDARSALQRARERIAAARREVRLALALEEGERIRFEQGDSHLLTVNIREQQTVEAELREVDALLDYHRALADLGAARAD